ncbi:MAG: glycosyltransferase [Candidatus Omnitrophota bacterium]
MNDRKKIIILYSTAGMGHKKAAIALFEAFKKRTDGFELEIIDVLDYASDLYKYIYLKFYVFLMSHGKGLWGIMYYLSNMPCVDRLTRNIRGKIDFKSLPGFGKMILKKQPDAIVASHFLLSSVAGILRKKGCISKLFTLITDYGPHSYWLSDYVDKFFVGTDSVKIKVAERDIPEDKIDATGIPAGEEFNATYDKQELCARYGADPGKKTIFLMSGGYGVGPIERMLVSLNQCDGNDIQVITVCGHNKIVYDNINRLREKLKYKLILFGFTDKVAELMAISDLMITKAGGISVTEALNMRLPMILFGSIPGQEIWNEELLLKIGAAERCKNVSDIPVIANKLLRSDGKYVLMKDGIDRIRRPDAADSIIDVVLKEIGA